MKSPRASIALAVLLIATTAQAAKIDMRDPRRAVGREDDVRVDAELAQESVSTHSKIGVVYQIQNLTQSPIALADKSSDATYDSDTQTITISFGAEVPDGATMPHLVVIGPGETKTFRGCGSFDLPIPNIRSPWAPLPRFVQVKVTVLRDLKPFAALIEQQNKTAAAPPLNNEGFDRWVNSVQSVFLNPIPVRFDGSKRNESGVDAEQGSPGGGSF
jgi:hypothetical protein